jgi:RNA polymerase sigma factor (sigma-70 family)
MEQSHEQLLEKAKQGDQNALEALVASIRDKVYGLAFKMLSHPADAEDATQEILVKVVTHLGSFRGESAFTSWVYRVAANHLLTTRKRRMERLEISFDVWMQKVDDGLDALKSSPVAAEPEASLASQETLLGCLHALLLCINRDLRMAFVLGTIVELNSTEASYILDISEVAYRQRLSRARKLLRDALWAKCGLVNPENPCRCETQAYHSVQSGFINPRRPKFVCYAGKGAYRELTQDEQEEMDEIRRVVDLFQGTMQYTAPGGLVENLKAVIAGG